MPKQRVKRHVVTQPLDQSYRLIPLTQGQNAMVDVEDFTRLSHWNWYANWSRYTKSFYASRSEKGRGRIPMHKTLCPFAQKVDHKDGNTLNNRKENLRPCTSSQNRQNSKSQKRNIARYKGVDPVGRRWSSRIGVKGKIIRLGMYDTEEEAARTYDDFAKLYFGEFSKPNFS